MISNAKCDETVADKKILLIYCPNPQRVLLTHTKAEKYMKISISFLPPIQSPYKVYQKAIVMHVGKSSLPVRAHMEFYGQNETSHIAS